MKQTALQQYTKQKKLYGQNQQQILDRFNQYADCCSDPINIYKYMEQKSICIYLANYWTSRAKIFAQMGDFKDAMLCLKQAKLRNHIVNQTEVRIDDHFENLKRKIVTAMKRYPTKAKKRSADQYNFLLEDNKKLSQDNLDHLIDIFQNNYKTAKKQIIKQFQLKRHGKNKSWLAPIEQQNQQKFRKISQKIKSSTSIQYFSMRTPISKKDPMRLTKTMDSVQMLKKKKSTQPKQKKQKLKANNKLGGAENDKKIANNCEGDDEHENDDDEEFICVNTTPVGRQLSILSRKVTFDTKKSQKYGKIQKIRSDSAVDENLSHTTSQKVRDGSTQRQKSVEKSKSISKRGSILKNKKYAQNYFNMDNEQ